MIVAAIDLGTITARILILSPGGKRIRRRHFCRLGEGVAESGILSAASLERTREALTGFAAMMAEAGVERVRVVATSAARDAANAADLIDMVVELIGVEPEILAGSAEGALAFAGAAGAHLRVGEAALTIDIGGGSTEFVLGTLGATEVESYSADMGASRITAAYLETDPPRPEELSAAMSIVEIHVGDARLALPGLAAAASGSVLGIGGSITTLAAIDLGLAEYDAERVNGHRLTRPAVEDAFRALATEGREARLHNPGLDPNRVDIIVGGICVLVETMRQLSIDEIVVSDYGILDGVAATLVGGDGR